MLLEVILFSCFKIFIKADLCGTVLNPSKPRDCQDVRDMGSTWSGIYHVVPDGTYRGFDVYCDMVTDNGGWLVFQRRFDGTESFNKEWNDYQQGFGNLTGEHWLGNLALHTITAQGYYELRVELGAWNGSKAYAKYKSFSIRDSIQKYQLTVGGFWGNAGDSLSHHNGHRFSTKDKDNDKWNTDNQNCADVFKSGWWFNKCHWSNLNGPFNVTKEYARGIIWNTWLGWYYSLKTTEMKLRRTCSY